MLNPTPYWAQPRFYLGVLLLLAVLLAPLAFIA
jgi:hypothetical protein